MDDFDDAMLSFALRDRFPSVLFLSKIRLLDTPALENRETISECDQTFVNIWFPRDGWKPLFFPHPDYPERFNLINPPDLFLTYYRTRWFFGVPQGERKWAFSLPMPESGKLSSGRWEWGPDQKEFRNAVTKLLGRLSSNRLKDWFQRNDCVPNSEAKRRSTWVGQNVMTWCSGEPNRAIDSMFRPPDEWKHKESPWYRDLKKRVIERFGEDYGGPRKFAPAGKRG